MTPHPDQNQHQHNQAPPYTDIPYPMAAALTMQMMSPPTSPTSLKRRRSPNLSIDLSTLPQLSTPSTPSNTLIVTNLESLAIFAGANLESIRQAIGQHADIHNFSPLKSFRRIIVSFYTAEDAIKIRQVLDGETVLGSRVRVYFGAETKIEQEDQHLQAPQSQKLFFISPPPSPPVGWEMRNEAPPNKDVHAEDLADALAKLHPRPAADDALREDMDIEHEGVPVPNRQRSGSSTLVFDPHEHGRSPDLPAIAVVDTTESPAPLSPMEGIEKKFVHTARPPVELIE